MSLLKHLLSTGRTGLHIGGTWRESSDASVLDVVDPATEETLASVADASVADGLAAVGAAADAADEWADTAPRDRSGVLRRAFDLIVERSEAFARLITLEPKYIGSTW